MPACHQVISRGTPGTALPQVTSKLTASHFESLLPAVFAVLLVRMLTVRLRRQACLSGRLAWPQAGGLAGRRAGMRMGGKVNRKLVLQAGSQRSQRSQRSASEASEAREGSWSRVYINTIMREGAHPSSFNQSTQVTPASTSNRVSGEARPRSLANLQAHNRKYDSGAEVCKELATCA